MDRRVEFRPVPRKRPLKLVDGTTPNVEAYIGDNVFLQGERMLNDRGFGQLGLFKPGSGQERSLWIKCLREETFSGRFKANLPSANAIWKSVSRGPVGQVGSMFDTLTAEPHFVKLYDIYKVNNDYFYVLDFNRNGSLHDQLLKANGPIPMAQVKQWSRDLLSSVDFMQSKGICHLRITPKHVLVAENGSVKLSAFLYAVAAYDDDKTLSLQRQVPRSSRNSFYPPECFRFLWWDPTQVDIFSTMVVTLVLATNYLPFSPTSSAKFSSQWQVFVRTKLADKKELAKVATKCFNLIPYRRPSASTVKNLPWLVQPNNEGRPVDVKQQVKEKTMTDSKKSRNSKSTGQSGSKKSGKSGGKTAPCIKKSSKPSVDERVWNETGGDAHEDASIPFVAVVQHSEVYDDYRNNDENSFEYGNGLKHKLVTSHK